MKKNNYMILVYVVIGFVFVLAISCKKTENEDITDNVYYKYNKDSVTDIDGNVYHTVTIGSQVWMLEDLKTTHYCNGDSINFVAISDSIKWNYTREGARCENSDGTIWGINSGYLYNWYTISDNRKICPAGWHVPTNAEFDTLKNYFAHSKNHNFLIEALKPAFSFKRYYNGKYSFCNTQEHGTWWTSTESDVSNSFGYLFSDGQLVEYDGPLDKRTGLCIRCIKD